MSHVTLYESCHPPFSFHVHTSLQVQVCERDTERESLWCALSRSILFGVHSLALYSLVCTLWCALSRSVSFSHTKEYDMIAGQREGDKKEDRKKGEKGRRERREDRDREGEGERERETEREWSECAHKKQKEEVGGGGGGHVLMNIHICMHIYIYIHTHVYIYIYRYVCVGGWGKSAHVR